MHQPPPVPEHPETTPPVQDPPSSSSPPAPPHAPPTNPTGEIGEHRSSWPGVLGTLMCVFAGLGILSKVWGVIGTALISFFPVPPEAQMPTGLWIFTLVVAIASLPIPFFHLVAGIQTLRRKPSARRWVVLYFAAVLIMLVPGLILQYLGFQHQMNVSQQQGGVPAGMGGLMAGIGVFAMIFAFLFTLAWPTFLMIWYSRGSIREQIAGWGGQ